MNDQMKRKKVNDSLNTEGAGEVRCLQRMV
jgi:hypothetical protein